MALPAGRLRETVAVETVTESRNSLGEPVQTWSTFATRRAEIVAESYSEQEQRDQVIGTQTFTVRMRFVAGITGKMRLRWVNRGGRLLYVSAVREVNNREEHEITAQEKVT